MSNMKNILCKLIKEVKQQKIFLLVVIFFVVLLLAYLFIFENKIMDVKDGSNYQIETYEQKVDDGVKEETSFLVEQKNFENIETKEQYEEWLQGKVLKIYNEEFYLDENYEVKYPFIDNEYKEFDFEKHNVLKRVNDDLVYVDYKGKEHNIIEVNDANIKNLNVGDYIYYGNYNNLISDEKELDLSIDRKLVFRIIDIDDGMALLHSVFAINNSYGNVLEDGYENSSLRTYLNDEFFHKVFTDDERKRIVKSEYKYKKNRDSTQYEKFNDYIGTYSDEDIRNFYAIGYDGDIMLKPRDIRNAYSMEDLKYFKQIWVMGYEDYLYKHQYGGIFKAYDRDRENESFVMPVLKINIEALVDENMYRLPDLDMLESIKKTFVLNSDLYFVDYDRNFIRVSNYNGEKIVDKAQVKILAKNVSYIYKKDESIYFTDKAPYGTRCVTLYKLKNNDEIEKVSDSVFPYIEFIDGNNFIFLKNTSVNSKSFKSYYANVAVGEIYQYKNDKIELDEELQNEKNDKNKRLIIEYDIGTKNINKGKVYDELNLVFYDKGEYHYVNNDGEEHKCTHYNKDDYYSNFNEDKNIFVKPNNIYFSLMSDCDNNKKYLYAFYKENGDLKKEIIDTAEYYIDFLYVIGNKLFYVKREEIENSYESTWTICSYEFSGKSEELYKAEAERIYYCSDIDKVFLVKYVEYAGVYHRSLEMLDVDGLKLIDEFVNHDNIIAIPEGIYYTTRGEDRALCYYNGDKVKLISKANINRAYHSADYRFVYFETLEVKVANLNDYLILPNKDDEYYKSKINGQNPNEFNYYSTSVYVACKDKIKKLADNAEITSSNDKIIMTTFKDRNEKKKEFREALEFVRHKNNSIFTTGSESISNYLRYLSHDIKFTYIFDGDKGSRFNKGDSYAGASYPWIIKDDVLACNGGGIFAGNIKYEEITNLYKLVNKADDNELRVMFVNIVNGEEYIYYQIQYKNSFDYNTKRIDVFCYHNGENELILENSDGVKTALDSEGNVYILRSSEYNSTIRKENLYKISIVDNKIVSEDFVAEVSNLKNYDTVERTYDEIREYGFYYENDEDNKSIVDKSFNEDNPEETILKDIDKSDLVNLNNKVNLNELKYKELSKEYVEGSKKYYQKTDVKVPNFYEKNGSLYAYINNELILIDDSFGYGDHDKIVYDSNNDEYYYSRAKYNQNGAYDGEMQSVRVRFKNKNIDKKVVAKIKVENPHYNYQIKYLGKLGKYYIWTDSNKKIFAGTGDSNVKEIDRVGNGSYKENYLDDEYVRGQTCFFVSLNTYENKLYYISNETLYVMDENLKSKKISDNVKEFIALQDECLYISGGLFRYSDDKSMKLFDIGDMSLYGRHNDKKCYLTSMSSKYIKDVFYIDDDVSDEVRKSYEDSKNYWLGYYGDIYLYENGELNKLIENVESPTNKVINDGENRGGGSMINSYIFTKKIVGKGEKINFNELYEYCKDTDMKDSKENYIPIRKYKKDKKVYAYLIDGYNISEIELDDDFIIYDTRSVVIDSIKDGILKLKYEYEDLECEIRFDDTVKNNYDIIYDENKFDKSNNDDEYYDEIKVILSENYLYDMFN